MAENSRHLIAAELAAALELIPTLEYSDELLRTLRDLPVETFLQGQPPLSAEQAAINCQQRLIKGPQDAPDVRILCYTPADTSSTLRPALLHIHGGGYFIGAPEMNDCPNRALAASLGCYIVSVDYRLAPETPYPGALEDCYAALQWLYNNADVLGVDPQRIAITGESAGAGHAAALAILARQRAEIPICLQLLDSPMLDDRTGTTSAPHPYCGEFVWTPELNRHGWRALLACEPGSPAVPDAAVPGRQQDLSNLPAACIIIGALDLFLEETLDYARRLIRCGVPTELHVIPGAYHGFTAAGPQAPQVQAYTRLCHAALARAWGK